MERERERESKRMRESEEGTEKACGLLGFTSFQIPPVSMAHELSPCCYKFIRRRVHLGAPRSYFLRIINFEAHLAVVLQDAAMSWGAGEQDCHKNELLHPNINRRIPCRLPGTLWVASINKQWVEEYLFPFLRRRKGVEGTPAPV